MQVLLVHIENFFITTISLEPGGWLLQHCVLFEQQL